MASEKRDDDDLNSELSADAQLTEIVAYLDGELSDEASSRIEHRLASDSPLRTYAESLDRTWQLLGELEETEVSGEFTQRTMSSLKTIAGTEDDPTTAVSQYSLQHLLIGLPWLQMIVWTTAGFISASVALLILASTQKPRVDADTADVLQNLELLERYPGLYPVPSVEFLKELHELYMSESTLRPRP